MNHELAKTLTTGLVQFIDKERPEGTMCCSNTECDALERAFMAEDFSYVEALVQKKLSRLTEFEQEVSDIVEYCKEHGESVAFDYAKRHAKTLLALAKKELQSEIDAEIEKAYKNSDSIVYENGVLYGKAEALKDLPRWKIWENGACGNGCNIPIAIVKRGYNYELVNTLFIQGEHYIMLSDLEKLPGLNDMDCINCPRKNIGGGFNMQSGTSTLKAEG